MPVLSNIRKAKISQSAQFLTLVNNLKTEFKMRENFFCLMEQRLVSDLLVTVFFDEVKLIVNSS